jgi:nuclear pore complex protein Nup160
MSRSYIPHALIHAHLPCPPTIPNSIPELHIPSELGSPSVFSGGALFSEHASSFSYSPSLNVLARVINNGYTLELRAFDTTIRKDEVQQGQDDDGSRIIRVMFPQQITSLPEDCIIVSPLDRRVYVLVYTEVIEEDTSRNVFYRLNFPLGSTKLGQGSRFSFTTRGNDDWVEEFQVPHDVLANCGGVGTWTVVDELNVLLGCGDGGILRVSRSNRGIHGKQYTLEALALNIRILVSSSSTGVFAIPTPFIVLLHFLRRTSHLVFESSHQ